MLVDWLILGIGALTRGIEGAKQTAKGNAELARLAQLDVWDRAEQEICPIVEINGKQYMFLSSYEISLNKKWWHSGKSLEETLVREYIRLGHNFPGGGVQMIDRNGVSHCYMSFDVYDLYKEWKESGKIEKYKLE